MNTIPLYACIVLHCVHEVMITSYNVMWMSRFCDSKQLHVIQGQGDYHDSCRTTMEGQSHNKLGNKLTSKTNFCNDHKQYYNTSIQTALCMHVKYYSQQTKLQCWYSLYSTTVKPQGFQCAVLITLNSILQTRGSRLAYRSTKVLWKERQIRWKLQV